jgi:hypothetical protein
MRRNSITPSRACLTIWCRCGFPALGGRQRAARLRLGRPRLHLDQAHPAVAGDAEALVIAEARDLLARKLARLEHGRACGDFELLPVDFELGHQRTPQKARRSPFCRSVSGDREKVAQRRSCELPDHPGWRGKQTDIVPPKFPNARSLPWKRVRLQNRQGPRRTGAKEHSENASEMYRRRASPSQSCHSVRAKANG